MKTRRLLSAPLAALLAAGMVGVAPAPLAPATVTAPSPQAPTDRAPAAAPVASPALVQRALGSGLYLMSARTSPIWLGSPKRGARRHRSRWNYRR